MERQNFIDYVRDSQNEFQGILDSAESEMTDIHDYYKGIQNKIQYQSQAEGTKIVNNAFNVQKNKKILK